ncbi:hypothetical protein ADK93_12145 [Streptomyces sp. XY58]|nr:hypothetical protein ADK93_12145 [Streptomyces sp. XY58]
MSPASPSASGVFTSSWYRGCRFSPLTSDFSSIGKVTPKPAAQKVWMSSALPGSCPPNWLQGTPMTVKPFASYANCRRASPEYCGVSPHCDAVFTRRIALPLCAARLVGSSDRVVSGMSYRLTGLSSAGSG